MWHSLRARRKGAVSGTLHFAIWIYLDTRPPQGRSNPLLFKLRQDAQNISADYVQTHKIYIKYIDM
ncbi:hypothetical protein D3Z48_12520 [Clostridiaceae bacterium]|nr:hypothetical protein [Clostridiaceae bacterium]